jgi:hypothetical protein
VVERFTERYLRPISANSEHKNGFTMMAVSCLMIESLESFRCGWPSTKKKSREAFKSFFSRWKEFEGFRLESDAFYEHVRCSLQHQAETTGGWRIMRQGPSLAGHTINATRFVAAPGTVLRSYATELPGSEWDSQIWENLRKKMDAICANTVP